MQVIIVSPSLDPTQNVSGISAVTQFIIDNNNQVEYIHFELGRKDNERGGWHRIPSIYRKLKEWRLLLKQYPDALIHYNFPLSKPSILRDPMFIRIARKMGRKMLIHIHGGIFLTSPHVPGYLNRILKWVFQGDEPFVVLSEGEKESLQSRYSCKDVHVLPNCIDLTDAKEYVRSYPPSLPIRLGYIGRIAKTKGMTELLEACKVMKERNVPFVLEIAGKEEIENEYLPLFKKGLGDNFVYTGVVSGQEKAEFLKRLDVFVLPTYFEGLPISLLECMSYGCVSMATPVGAIPTVMIGNVNGLFVPLHDASSIVSGVEALLNDEPLYERLSLAARQTVFDKFSPSKYVEELNMIYDRLCVR